MVENQKENGEDNNADDDDNAGYGDDYDDDENEVEENDDIDIDDSDGKKKQEAVNDTALILASLDEVFALPKTRRKINTNHLELTSRKGATRPKKCDSGQKKLIP